MAQKPAPLREQTRSVVRALLAKTALELFAAKGYDDTTLDEIAAAAGVSKRTLFNYFPGKLDAVLGPVPVLPEDPLDTFRAGGPHHDLV